MSDTVSRLPSVFIPHGGGPCFFMDWPGNPHMWDDMANFLRGLGKSIGVKPKAIVAVSAHWEEAAFTVMSNPRPPMLFDYYGFPEHTYRLDYPAPGSPALAQRIQDLLGAAGIASKQDAARGFDHGVFIPFLLMYPEADIPVVQLSLKAGMNLVEHIRAGQALEALRDEGVLIVGSGMSFHNMRGFSRPEFGPVSQRFDTWLDSAATRPDASGRNALLSHWSDAPDARQTHPHPDHLLPLMVAAGAAGNDAGRKIFGGEVMGVVVSAYSFG